MGGVSSWLIELITSLIDVLGHVLEPPFEPFILAIVPALRTKVRILLDPSHGQRMNGYVVQPAASGSLTDESAYRPPLPHRANREKRHPNGLGGQQKRFPRYDRQIPRQAEGRLQVSWWLVGHGSFQSNRDQCAATAQIASGSQSNPLQEFLREGGQALARSMRPLYLSSPIVQNCRRYH